MNPDRKSLFGPGFAALLLALSAGLQIRPALAEEAHGRVIVKILAPDKTFKSHPVSVSAVIDGRIHFQRDVSLEAPPNKAAVILDELPIGTCDVRVEGEGLITEVKRGVQIFERDREVEIVVRPGEGVHIVELAIGGLAREEVAARLRRLEETTAQLEKQMAERASPPGN